MASSGIKHDFLDPPKDSADDLGTLGNYRVVRELGKGGMGYVFLAEDTRLKRQVALKVMNQKIAGTPGSRKRFISEARAMASVHHDNVATIFEVGERKGTPFMAMELLEGATLENYRELHGEPDFHTIIAYARDIARGLAAAHAQGIVHRDIKPANIWLDTKTGRIKILDFGLALAQTPVDQLSGRGAVVGTPGYLSPEQARSEPLDDRSDLYSTGVVLYELATGSLPLKTKTVADQLIAILAHSPKPIRERNEKIPEPLAELIHRLMAKEPRDRYPSAKALEESLDTVEVECEKKSEVAQAINQLQLGLEQAVKKKSDDDSFGLGDPEHAPPNPFETLPDALPPATPIAGGVGSSGIHAAVPVASGPLAAGPLAGRPIGSGAATNKKNSAAPTSNSKVIYIAVGVGAALVLLLVPAIVYFSDSSAIARQQNQNAIVVGAGQAASGNAAAKPNNPGTPKQQTPKQQAPKPKQPAATPNRPGNRPGTTQPAIIKVSAKKVDSAVAEGSKWILGNKQNNGSFEEGQPTKGQLKIPGWSAKVSGADAGWDQIRNARNPAPQTFAYAGSNSELVLTSDILKHQTKAGDVFRVSLVIGGEGPGKSDYKVVLGFKGNSGPETRFQLLELADASKWQRGQSKLTYEYTVDAAAAGKRPFVELTVSNLKSQRKRAMLDRVVVTVQSKANLAARSKSTSSPNAQPASKGPMLASSQPKSTPPQSTQPAQTTSPSSKPTPTSKPSPPKPAATKPARTVALTTADEGGADATVKRNSSASDPLGEESTLVIQTRNDRQIQHAYLRFPIYTLRSGNGGQNPNNRNRGGGQNAKPLPVISAELKLTLTSDIHTSGATIQVYGLNDVVSDFWPEQKIVWGNSLSAKGLETLPVLAEYKIRHDDKVVSIASEKLANFVAESNQRSVTLILTGSQGNELITIVSKDQNPASAPSLTLGLSE